MKLLHSADFHLDNTSGPRFDAVSSVLQCAQAVGADVVTISGDMFNKAADVARVKPLLRELFDGFAGHVVLIPGNHDERGLGAGDFFGERVRVLDETAAFVDVGPYRLIGLPFEDVSQQGVLERLLRCRDARREGACNVLLYHGELLDMVPQRGAFGEETDGDYMPLRLHSLDDTGFDFVLAGHFHRNFDIREYRGGYFVYPGSPVSITRKETGVRSAAVVEPSKAPVPVALTSQYVEEVRVLLDPTDQDDPIARIKYQLNQIPGHARVFLEVGGFPNLGEVGLTEREFATALSEIALRPEVAELKNTAHDARVVLDHDLFVRFMHRLNKTDIVDEERRAIRDVVLTAMMETIYAD